MFPLHSMFALHSTFELPIAQGNLGFLGQKFFVHTVRFKKLHSTVHLHRRRDLFRQNSKEKEKKGNIPLHSMFPMMHTTFPMMHSTVPWHREKPVEKSSDFPWWKVFLLIFSEKKSELAQSQSTFQKHSMFALRSTFKLHSAFPLHRKKPVFSVKKISGKISATTPLSRTGKEAKFQGRT